MFDRFDTAIAKALSSEHSLYGKSDRSVATASARRASAENRVKAMNEATLGKVSFAALHDTASDRFHTDAELMAQGQPPQHHAVSFYLSMAQTFKTSDARKAVEPKPASAVPSQPARAA